MIPNNSWSTDAQLKEYATYGKAKPLYVSLNAHFIILGPVDVSVSNNNLTVKWWLFELIDNVFKLFHYDEIGSNWVYHSDLFTPVGCVSFAAAFDQLGKPLLFNDTGSELLLWWFDPTTSTHVSTVFGEGSHPFATFDLKYGVDTEYSDVLLFYMRSGAIYYRMQRDRYSIEYATPVVADAVFIKEADMATDYRLQLLYRYIDTGYNPPQPTPPIVDPVIGYFAYLMTGYQSAIEIVEPNIISATKPFSIEFQLDNVEALNTKSTLFSYGNLKKMPKASLCFSGEDSDNIELNFFGYSFKSKILFGLQSGHWLIEFYPLSGIGPIDSMRLSCKPKGSDTYQACSIEGVVKPTNTAKGQVLRIGSRPSYGERVYQVASDVSSGFVPDSEYAFGLRAAISNIEVHTAIVATPVIKIPMTKAQGETQTLLDATDLPIALLSTNINDYRAANWVFIKS